MQVVQFPLPPSEKDPEKQVEQVVPINEVPAAQAVGFPVVISQAEDPVAQGVHPDAPAKAYVPTEQVLQPELPA